MTIIIQSIAIELIDVPRRLRGVDDDHIAMIAGSIEQKGLLQPIKVQRSGERFRLVFGNHRLEAFKLLGKSHIDAVVADESADEPSLLSDEIWENLGRHDLNVIDRATHLGELRKLHVAAHGDKTGRPKLLKNKDEKVVQQLDFVRTVSGTIRMSRASIFDYLSFYTKLIPEVRDKLAASKFADDFAAIKQLVSKDVVEHQSEIVDHLLTGKATTVAEAASQVLNKTDTTNPDEKLMAAFVKLWAKASKKTRRRITAYVSEQE